MRRAKPENEYFITYFKSAASYITFSELFTWKTIALGEAKEEQMRRTKPENEYFITDSKSVASLNLLVNYLFKPLLIL